MSEERVSFVPSRYGHLIGQLPESTMTISGFYDAGLTAPYYRAMQGKPIRVMVMVPRNRWQAFKANHEDAWWMRWFTSRCPVLTKPTHRFTGYVSSFEDGEATITADGPVERA